MCSASPGCKLEKYGQPSRSPSGSILTFAPRSGWSFANVRIKGPLANIGFQWSFGFDIRFANSGLRGRECQIHSTGLPQTRFPVAFPISLVNPPRFDKAACITFASRLGSFAALSDWPRGTLMGVRMAGQSDGIEPAQCAKASCEVREAPSLADPPAAPVSPGQNCALHKMTLLLH